MDYQECVWKDKTVQVYSIISKNMVIHADLHVLFDRVGKEWNVAGGIPSQESAWKCISDSTIYSCVMSDRSTISSSFYSRQCYNRFNAAMLNNLERIT